MLPGTPWYILFNVVVFNRVVWRRCYRLAETRFSLSK